MFETPSTSLSIKRNPYASGSPFTRKRSIHPVSPSFLIFIITREYKEEEKKKKLMTERKGGRRMKIGCTDVQTTDVYLLNLLDILENIT